MANTSRRLLPQVTTEGWEKMVPLRDSHRPRVVARRSSLDLGKVAGSGEGSEAAKVKP